ncbi:MAG: glycosyltransferase, partial [Dokdonella sp.]
MTDTAAQGLPSPGPPILVLGMHRSGTSALARVLDMMGAWIGDDDDLLPPHPTDNPTGYWERADVVHSHEDFLGEVGHAWDRVAGFDWEKLRIGARNELDARLRTVTSRFDSGGRPWLLKDPRLCLLLPAWRRIVSDPVYVVAVRNPRETAVSMLSSHRGVYTSHFLLALWERYLHHVLADLVGERVLFVSYSQLLEEPVDQAARLLDGLTDLGVVGLQLPAVEALGRFLDVRLKRSRPLDHMLLSPSQQALDQWLIRQCAADGPVLVEPLADDGSAERVLLEYERAADHQTQIGGAQALGNVTDRLIKLEHELQAHREEAERTVLDAQQRAQTAEERARLAVQEVSDVEMQVSELHLRLSDALHESERLAGESALTRNHAFNLTGQIDSLGLQVESNLATIDALQRSLSWRITRPVRWLAKALTPRIPYRMEQWLYRAYYAIPGINTTRKRALITWLHRKLPWLTRSTLSHDINARTEALVRQRTGDSDERKRLQRINAEQATAFVARMTETPLISIVMPVYNVEPRWLNAAVESVRTQFYPNWQLCIADDASTLPATREALDAIEAVGDERIVVTRLESNQGIAGASNAALELATGDYVGLLDHDDELTRDALLEMVRQIIQKRPDLLYSDEDKLDEEGRHIDPHFKPDFSPDYLLSNNYVCHFSVLKRELIDRIGGFRPGFDGAQDFDLMLRATEAAQTVVHVPQVLYHWRRVPGSTAVTSAAKPESSIAGRRALVDAMKRRDEESTIEPGPFPNTFRVRRNVV